MCSMPMYVEVVLYFYVYNNLPSIFIFSSAICVFGVLPDRENLEPPRLFSTISNPRCVVFFVCSK